MDMLLGLVAIMLCLTVVFSTSKNERGILALARVTMRVLAVVLLVAGFGIAFGVIEIPTKYYGFVKLGHQLNYAMVFELGALTLSVLSRR